MPTRRTPYVTGLGTVPLCNGARYRRPLPRTSSYRTGTGTMQPPAHYLFFVAMNLKNMRNLFASLQCAVTGSANEINVSLPRDMVSTDALRF